MLKKILNSPVNCDKIFNFVVWYSWFVLSIERSGFAWVHLVVLLGILLEAILLVTRVKMYSSPVEKTQRGIGWRCKPRSKCVGLTASAEIPQ